MKSKSIICIWDYLKLRYVPLVEIEDDFRNKICTRIIEYHGSYKNFSREMSIPYTSLYNCLFKVSRNILRLNVLCRVCENLGIPRSEIKRNVILLRPRKIKDFCLPIKLTPSGRLASLVGHALGDGHIGNAYHFSYTNTSEALHHEVLRDIRQIFDERIKPRVKFHKAYTYSYTYIVGATLTLCGVPRCDRKSADFDVPEWIKFGEPGIKKWFIRSLFDDEASVKVKSREIIFKLAKVTESESSLDTLLESLRGLLGCLGIEPSPIRIDGMHESKKRVKTIQKAFGIHGQRNFKLFEENIGFSHPKKREALSSIIKNCTFEKHRSYEAQNKIMRLLRNPMTTREIATRLGITPLAAYKNLRKMEKGGAIFQKRFPKNTPSLWERMLKSSKLIGEGDRIR